MIIKKLILNNFRVLKGRHEIVLSPENGTEKNKPIILFGGLNGAGKTSILTAVRLALYGRMAFENIISNQDYIDQLSDLIFKNTQSNDENINEASIELVFTYNKSGKESEFTIIRHWQWGSKDNLILYKDNQLLNELNYEQCQGFLNELIPNGIADLFFFDGEKIAALAEDESGKILQVAVRRLLGLDIIDKLRNDLIILLKKKNATEINIAYKKQLDILESQKVLHAQRAERYRYDADLLKNKIDLSAINIQKYESELYSQGGAFALTKNEEMKKVELLIREKELLEKNIRNELDGLYPLTIAPNSLANLLNMLKKESDSKQANSFIKELNLFLNDLKTDIAFRSSSTYKIASQAIEEQLNNYIKKKQQSEIMLDISDREFSCYQHAIEIESIHSKSRFESARKRLIEVEILLEQASINIQRAPDDEQLMDLFNKFRELDSSHQLYISEYKVCLDNARKEMAQQLDCARKIQKLHDKARSQYNIDNAIENAQQTVRLLDDYSKALLQYRINTLQTNFISSYKRLARKENSQLTARINPDNFDVELINERGLTINRKSLSAGEKQIYAIAILEALGKTSGRQLPIIIDTPLGRLDSKHRDKLVEYYFPVASHQVIILSTDTEIDKEYYTKYLHHYVSRAYQINFDSQTNSSNLTSGYFWRNESTQSGEH